MNWADMPTNRATDRHDGCEARVDDRRLSRSVEPAVSATCGRGQTVQHAAFMGNWP